MKYDYSFTEEEARAAYEEWGCNCGPSALAFALQVKLESVRYAIPGFEEKRYTSPTMMKAALQNLGKNFVSMPVHDIAKIVPVAVPISPAVAMFHREISLVRVQWSGPWTQPNVNPKWAYRQTHWIAAWRLKDFGQEGGMMQLERVFDCNGGIRTFASWVEEIVPSLIATYPRADGGWFPTHVWRLA